jgi:hypothetical protein
MLGAQRACAWRLPLPDVVLGAQRACARHGRGPDARVMPAGGAMPARLLQGAKEE